MPARGGRSAGPGRGTHRKGMGRRRRPVHQHGEDHHPPAPGQARRPAGDPDRPGERLPHRRALRQNPRLGPPRWLLPRRTTRLRLTFLYGAAFLACSAAVLGVFAYLLFGTTHQPTASQPTTSASATLQGRAPIADVHPAGPYDVVPVRIPVADVHRSGRYDLFNFSGPVTAPKQQSVLTAAQFARLQAELRTAAANPRINYDKREILIICAIILAAITVAAASIGWGIPRRA